MNRCFRGGPTGVAAFTSSRVLASALLALLLAVGCRSPVPTHAHALRLDVPFRPQEEHQCGAAALGMVLDYWQRPVPAARLEATLYIPVLRGTIPALLLDAAREHGLRAQAHPATVAMLQEALQRGQPPIVFLGPERPGETGHFAVLTGIRHDTTAFRLHEPARPDRWWPATRFDERWSNGGYLALFFEPAATPPAPAPHTSEPLTHSPPL